MRLPVIAASFFLLLQQPSVPGQQQPLKGTIEGVVLRVGTGEPVAEARVTLTKLTPAAAAVLASGGTGPIDFAPPPPPPPIAGAGGAVGGTVFSFTSEGAVSPSLAANIPQATADEHGRFTFKDLDAGAYRLSVVGNGYVRQEYGQRVFGGLGTTINLAAGQSLKDLAIRLTPAGNVSGTIRDQAGRPQVGVPVQVLKATYNASGQRTFQSAGSARTNDRGEYRLYWITPGRYYLNAGTNPGPPNRPPALGGATGSPNEVPGETYTMTYYPGVTDLSQAALLDVQPAGELSAVDLNVTRQQQFSIRGRVVDSRTSRPPGTVNVGLAFQNLTGGGGSFSSGQNYNPATGEFELRNVIPGSYVVQATAQDTASNFPADPTARTVAVGARPSARSPVEVSNADVEGIVLVLAPGGSIPGRLAVDGQSLSSVAGLNRLRVQLRPSVGGVASNAIAIGAVTPQAQPVNPDGTFRVDGTAAGEYRVTVGGLQPGYYVKSVRYDQADALNQPLQFGGSESATLDVVISPNAGQLQGVVTDNRLQPAPGIQAVLVPDRTRDRTELYRTSTTDQNGRFTIANIPPGEYKIFAWEAIEQFAYFDPDLLKRFESQGKPVHVTESSRETVDVKMIPAGQ